MTTEDLIAMNLAVDFEREEPADVAAAFLQSKGLG
jgi:glycine betaine/choline ABC-type transport system substrate-binding protein